MRNDSGIRHYLSHDQTSTRVALFGSIGWRIYVTRMYIKDYTSHGSKYSLHISHKNGKLSERPPLSFCLALTNSETPKVV
jgi:hypothetical protein